MDLAAKLKDAIVYGKCTEGRKRIEDLGLDNSNVAEKLIGIYNSVLSK